MSSLSIRAPSCLGHAPGRLPRRGGFVCVGSTLGAMAAGDNSRRLPVGGLLIAHGVRFGGDERGLLGNGA
jgi:hypothetical protein